MSGEFTQAEYERIREGCQSSARAVVPYVNDLVRPKTVIDVGGGEGWWGREFAKHECQVVVLDSTYPEGDPTEVDVGMMVPGEVQYRHVDLADPRAQMIPMPPSGMYDLAVCLEVAEHLPEYRAAGLVGALCGLTQVVMFSAAIPGQGGHGHVNEQWPQYWADLFHANNFVASDIRDTFWDDDHVEPWYRQNLLIFGSLDADWMGDGRLYNLAQIPTTTRPRSLVHPDIYGWRIAERDQALNLADGFTWTGP